MKLSILYFRSRSIGFSVVGLITVTLLAWLGARVLLAQPWAFAEITLFPVLLFAPLIVACIVSTSARNPFGEAEWTASYPVPVLRLLHLAGLLASGSLLLSLAASDWNLPGAEMFIVRNFLGLSGISFLTSWILGSGLSWTVPLSYVAIVQLSGRDMNGDWALWAWPAHSITSAWPTFVAIVLLAMGIFAACFLKPLRTSTLLE